MVHLAGKIGLALSSSPPKTRYIGFIVDGALPSITNCLHLKCSPRVLLSGWPQSSSVAQMRFQWLAELVNADESQRFHYELYRPWRKYAVVVFLKSMGKDCLDLVHRLRRSGVRSIFDLNVDYLTPAFGVFYYSTMAPTSAQREAAMAMVTCCDAVIADSSHLAEVASQSCRNVRWIADNVRAELISQEHPWRLQAGTRLPVFWCGEAVKLYDLLVIKDILLEFADKIQLRIITSSMGALSKWPESLRNDFYQLLDKLPHQLLLFETVEKLMAEYSEGGIFISPRYLDNSYNLGHTEWKITLPMARGLVVLCSDQQSYKDVSDRSGGRGIRICAIDEDWRQAFREVFADDFSWESEQKAAVDVVKKYYSTPVICRQHIEFLQEVLDG